MYAVRKPRENGRDETMNNLVARVKQWHDQFFALVSYLQSPFLLFVRLYWGWQLAQSGWGKLHHLPNVTEYFGSLGLPMPAQMAVFIACVEFFGGIFLPGSRASYSPLT
jgi:putative oxidoreductase